MNTWKVEKIQLDESNSITKHIITGKSPGPKVHIQSSVHGAELMGNEVCAQILDFLKNVPINGSINLIFPANPYGIMSKSGTYTTGRFCSITGNNWNRNFVDITKSDFFQSQFQSLLKEKNLKGESTADIIKKYKGIIEKTLDHFLTNIEYGIDRGKRLSLILQKEASRADILLDLHTGPKACEYLYVSKRQKEMSLDFHFKNQIIIPNEFFDAMDESFFTPWVALEKELSCNFICGEAYTVELGSEETIQSDTANYFTKKIINFFEKRGLLSESNGTKNQRDNSKITIVQSPLEKFKTYYKNTPGLIQFCKSPGDTLKKGDLLYKTIDYKNLDNKKNSHIHEIKAIQDGVVINHSPSPNLPFGIDVYQILEL